MKNSILKLSLCLIMIATTVAISNAQDSFQTTKETPITKGKPVMTFEKDMIDLGTVKRGEKRTTYFDFTNTGDVPLQIDLISACECTTTDYPRGEIAPGETGRIDVIFDSTEKEASETIDIDIYLKQFDEEAGMPFIEMVQYKFELIQ